MALEASIGFEGDDENVKGPLFAGTIFVTEVRYAASRTANAKFNSLGRMEDNEGVSNPSLEMC